MKESWSNQGRKSGKGPKKEQWIPPVVIGGILLLVFICWLVSHVVKIKDLPHPKKKDLWEHNFRNGDLILFNSRGFYFGIDALFLKMGGGSCIAHVGMVYKDPNTQHLYVWHSQTGYNGRHGSHLTPLYGTIESYPGCVYTRPISHEIDGQVMQRVIRELWGTQYSFDFLVQAYNRYFPFLSIPYRDYDPAKKRDYFCCDFVLETLRRAGVLDFNHGHHKPHQALPRDFLSHNEDDKLPLKKPYSYGKEILLVPRWKQLR